MQSPIQRRPHGPMPGRRPAWLVLAAVLFACAPALAREPGVLPNHRRRHAHQRRPGAEKGRDGQGRAGLSDRQREHEQRLLAEARQAGQRAARAGRRRRHRHHPRHGHDRGDRLFSRPRREEPKAGRRRRRDAAVDRDQRGRADQPLQRGRGRRQPGGGGQGRAGRAERPDQRRARRDQSQHHDADTFRTPSSASSATCRTTSRTSTGFRRASTRPTASSTSAISRRCRRSISSTATPT